MTRRLPGWVVSEAESLREEARPYRDLSPEERAEHMVMACRAAAILLEARDDRERVLAYRDPLPESSVRALARLRRESLERRSGRTSAP